MVFGGMYPADPKRRREEAQALKDERDPRHYSRLLHPIRWVRWRLEVHRKGPYAPDYGKQSQPKANDDYSDGTAIEPN
jgi:hypothetical protein